MKKQNVITQIVLVFFLLLLVGMVVQLLPLVIEVVTHADDVSGIVSQVGEVGWRGVPALVALTALQVIIPFIPAPAVGILTGLSYGVYGGSLIFLSGIALGNLFVMNFVRRLRAFVKQKRKKESTGEGFHLKDRLDRIKKPEIAAFFLVLAPFISVVGPYLFAETKISQGKYIAAVVLGTIPSTILYVFLGSNISTGDYTTAIIIGAVAATAIICVLIFRKKLMEKIFQTSEK